MHHPKGGFAGKYVVARRIEVTEQPGQGFDIQLRLEEFKPEEARFPGVPIGLELADCWCLTVREDLGLRISSVELSSVKL